MIVFVWQEIMYSAITYRESEKTALKMSRLSHTDTYVYGRHLVCNMGSFLCFPFSFKYKYVAWLCLFVIQVSFMSGVRDKMLLHY